MSSFIETLIKAVLAALSMIILALLFPELLESVSQLFEL